MIRTLVIGGGLDQLILVFVNSIREVGEDNTALFHRIALQVCYDNEALIWRWDGEILFGQLYKKEKEKKKQGVFRQLFSFKSRNRLLNIHFTVQFSTNAIHTHIHSFRTHHAKRGKQKQKTKTRTTRAINFIDRVLLMPQSQSAAYPHKLKWSQQEEMWTKCEETRNKKLLTVLPMAQSSELGLNDGKLLRRTIPSCQHMIWLAPLQFCQQQSIASFCQQSRDQIQMLLVTWPMFRLVQRQFPPPPEMQVGKQKLVRYSLRHCCTDI